MAEAVAGVEETRRPDARTREKHLVRYLAQEQAKRDAGTGSTVRRLSIRPSRNRVGGSRHAVQLFFDVCATKPLNCGTTFVPWHFGHFTPPFSRSEKVMINSKGLLHFSHMNS